MRFASPFLLCAALAALGAPMTRAASDAPFGGTLADVLQRALDSNPDLQAFEARYRAALERIPQAAALPDPRIQITHFVEPIQTRTGAQDNAIALTQNLPWFGKLGERKAAASAEAEALGFALRSRQLALVRVVATGFYELAYTGRAIGLTGESLALLRRLEPVVAERVRGGADMNGLLRLRLEIGRVEDRLRSHEQMRSAQAARLAALLALPDGAALSAPAWSVPPSDLPGRAAAMEALVANSPELAMLDRRVASAEARRELARLEAFPELTLGVNYLQLDAYEGSTMAPPGADPWSVTLGLSLPVWKGRVRAAREEARQSEVAAASERRDRENMLRADLAASLAGLEDANRRLQTYGGDLLSLAQQAVEITQTSYEGGRATLLDLIDSERSLLDLRLQYWRAAADAWQQRVAIQALTQAPIAGVSLTGGDSQ